MSAIYNPDTDEITTQLTEGAVGVTPTTSPSASTSEVTTPPLPEGIGEVSPRDGGVNTDILPGVQSQIDNLNTQREAELNHIDSNYNQYLEQYDTEGNAIDALTSTVKKRKVVDPEQMRIRRNIANLYDALQLTGSLAGMAAGGRGTIGTPAQLTSASAAHNTLAERLQEQQRQADNAYTEALANLAHRQQTARANLNKQRAQVTANYDKQRAAINKHYDNLETKIIEGERKRRQEYTLTLRKEATKIQVAQSRLAKKGVKNSDEFIPYDNAYYKIDPKYRTALSYDASDFAQRYYIDMSDFKRENNLNSKNAAAALIISALNGTLPILDENKPQAYQDALDIFQTYFIESTPTATQTDNQQSTSGSAIEYKPNKIIEYIPQK